MGPRAPSPAPEREARKRSVSNQLLPTLPLLLANRSRFALTAGEGARAPIRTGALRFTIAKLRLDGCTGSRFCKTGARSCKVYRLERRIRALTLLLSRSRTQSRLKTGRMLTNKRAVTLSTFLLLFSLAQSLIPATLAQQSSSTGSSSTQRDRIVSPAVAPSPTPGPSPTATLQPTPAVVQPRTLSPNQITRSVQELQTRINAVLAKPELAQAMVGVKVTSMETGHVLFESNANKLLRPASNMKLYTLAAALDRLSPEHRFVTSIYAPAQPDGKGVVHGDLTIYGRGDPSIGFRFNEGNYFKAINELAARIVAAGVKRVEGDLVGDESYFSGPPYGGGWEWEDLQWWYGAEVSALTVNDNFLDTFVKPGNKAGAPAVITTGPPNPLLRITNKVVTVANGTKRDLTVYRPLGSDTVEFSGSIALDDRGYSGRLAISRPALLFVYLLRASLAQQGVNIKGKTRTVDSISGDSLVTRAVTAVRASATSPTTDRKPLIEIGRKESVPFSLIAAQTMKPSQNLYTELILRTLGQLPVSDTAPPPNLRTSEERGLYVIKTFLKEAGIEPTSLSLTDGSGLSRNDMITAEATMQLLTYMHSHRYAKAFWESLPIAGVDGTLRNRMKGTPAENNLRAKTGTLSSASSLSGYVTSAGGERLAFSIMVNNYPGSTDPQAACIDPISVLLASFAGKSDSIDRGSLPGRLN